MLPILSLHKSNARRPSAINWKPPNEGEFKSNCDGAVSMEGVAACGGVIRDHCDPIPCL